MIGGGAMAFYDIKDATKDIDVIVQSGKEIRRLQSALESLGYSVLEDLDTEYEQLGAQRILENGDGCRFDVFNRQVVGKLILSESMRERSQPIEEMGDLTVSVAATEDIFLFKSVAGRTGDIADMNTLVQTGLTFDAIESEIETQIRLLGEEFFVTFIGEALGDLEERFNVTTPLTTAVDSITVRVYEQLEILLQIEQETTIATLTDAVDIPESRLQSHMAALEEKGVIRRDGDTITATDKRP